jgi:hypothetical protein
VEHAHVCMHACTHRARRHLKGCRPAAQAHARSCVLLYMLWVSLAKQSAGCGSGCCWPQLVMVWFAVLPVGWPARLLSLRRSTCGDQLRVSLSTGLCKQGVERQVLAVWSLLVLCAISVGVRLATVIQVGRRLCFHAVLSASNRAQAVVCIQRLLRFTEARMWCAGHDG